MLQKGRSVILLIFAPNLITSDKELQMYNFKVVFDNNFQGKPCKVTGVVCLVAYCCFFWYLYKKTGGKNTACSTELSCQY
jgi:hypothetical protein